MAATRFEFEWRFWIIAAIFGVAFALVAFDNRAFGEWAAGLIAPLFHIRDWRQTRIDQFILIAGVMLVFLAVLFRTWATAWLGAEIMADRKLHSDTLLADGPYRHTRNPLYFANLPLALGVGVFASPTGLVFLCLGMFVFVYRLILREEASLRQSLGPGYQHYVDAVPRLWPALRPRWPASGQSSRWAQALIGEAFLWLIGLSLLVFVLTFNQYVLFGGVAASFAASFYLPALLKKRLQSAARRAGDRGQN